MQRKRGFQQIINDLKIFSDNPFRGLFYKFANR